MSDYKKIKIVDSMSIDEILDLLKDDVKFLQHKIDEHTKQYRRLIKNSSKPGRFFYEPMNYESARGFHYFLQFFKRAENEEYKDKLGILYYVWFIKNRGMYAVTVSRLSITGHSELHLTVYTPHFIDRYRERFLKDLSISKSKAFLTYYKNNLKMATSGRPSEKYPKGYWAVCNDGLCLCNRMNGLTVEATTFITYDMAGKEQKQFSYDAKTAMLDRGFEINLPEEDFEEFVIDDN